MAGTVVASMADTAAGFTAGMAAAFTADMVASIRAITDIAISLTATTVTDCVYLRPETACPGLARMPLDGLPPPTWNKPRASLVLSGAGRQPAHPLRTDRGVERKSAAG
jgi:hypothetical protein